MQITVIVKEILLLGFLFVAAWMDHKRKELPMEFVIAMSLTGIIFQIIAQQIHFWNLFLGCLLGGIFLGLGKITRQALGYGDGWMLVATGIFLGFSENMFLLLLGFSLAAIFSIGLLIFQKKKKNDAIPFMPFLLAGYIFLLVLG